MFFICNVINYVRCISAHTTNLACTVLRQSAYRIQYVCCSIIFIIYSIYNLLIKITFTGI